MIDFLCTSMRRSRSWSRLAVLALALALAAATAAVPAQAGAAEGTQLSFAETPTGWSVTSGEASEVGTVTATGVNARRIRYSLERSRGFKIGGKTGAVSYTGAERAADSVTLTITATDRKNKATPATIDVTVTINQPETQQPEIQQPEIQQPELQQPEFQQPELQQPEIQQPEVEVVQPDPERYTPEPELHTSGNVGDTHDGKSYAELRCEHWLGGTWRDDTNSCSRPGKVVWRSEVTVQIYPTSPTTRVTVTGGGPGSDGFTYVSFIENGRDRKGRMVPGTMETTYTWHACDRADNHGEKNCREFERNLAFKYVAPDQIPSWDTRAKQAYAAWKADSRATRKVEPGDDRGAAASMNQPGSIDISQLQPQQQQAQQPQQQRANAAPQFATNSAARSVDENSPAGTSVGDPITATDTDGDTLTYSLAGSDAFTIDGSGHITVASGAALDHEAQASHEVTVTATDPHGAAGSIAVTVVVVNVNEPGVVSFIPEQPVAGSGFTAAIIDPDGVVAGSVKWQWKRSPDGTTAANVDRTDFPNIAGATGNILALTDADEGRWLRALAIYEDPFGPGQRARSQTDNPVLPPLQRNQEPSQEQNNAWSVAAIASVSCMGEGENQQCTFTNDDNPSTNILSGLAKDSLFYIRASDIADWSIDNASAQRGIKLKIGDGTLYDGNAHTQEQTIFPSYDGTEWPENEQSLDVVVTATPRTGDKSRTATVTVKVNRVGDELKIEAVKVLRPGEYEVIDPPAASVRNGDASPIIIVLRSNYGDSTKWSIDAASAAAGFGLKLLNQTDYTSYPPGTDYATVGWGFRRLIALSYDGSNTSGRTVTVTATGKNVNLPDGTSIPRIRRFELDIAVTVDPNTVYPSLRSGRSSRSYPQLRCTNWLGGTWRDDTNSCSRPGKVVFDRKITAEIFASRNNNLQWVRSDPAKIVTVTGGGPGAGGMKTRADTGEKFKPTYVSYRENGRDRTGIMVPGTKTTTYTWEACNARGENCGAFARNLALKYAFPDQIPSWDKAAQCAYNRWRDNGRVTVPEPKHVGTSVTEPLPGCTLP